MRPADTSAEAWAAQMQALRRMTPEQKGKLTVELAEMAVRLTEAGVRERYPLADDREVFLRGARIRLGRELFRAVYGRCLGGDE